MNTAAYLDWLASLGLSQETPRDEIFLHVLDRLRLIEDRGDDAPDLANQITEDFFKPVPVAGPAIRWTQKQSKVLWTGWVRQVGGKDVAMWWIRHVVGRNPSGRSPETYIILDPSGKEVGQGGDLATAQQFAEYYEQDRRKKGGAS